MSTKKFNIYLADDHPIYCEGLVKIIERDESFTIAGTAMDGKTAVADILLKKPDIAILDVSMPVLSGIEIAKRIKLECLHTRVVILTMYDNEEIFEEALETGVMGYLLKDSASGEILRCIKSVLGGKRYISPAFSDFIVNEKRTNKLTGSALLLQRLTPKEKEILSLLARNKTSHEIADELFLSVRTIQNHRMRIATKLGLAGHNKLLQFALENKKLLV